MHRLWTQVDAIKPVLLLPSNGSLPTLPIDLDALKLSQEPYGGSVSVLSHANVR
jgi:hypothetical protein